jgi:hypothetical protein
MAAAISPVRLLEQRERRPSNPSAALIQLAEIRARCRAGLIESPDGLAGVVRGHEVGELIAAGAPLYVKFGLRNSRGLYPAGGHLMGEAVAVAREKVRRAAIAMEWLRRTGPERWRPRPALGSRIDHHVGDRVAITRAVRRRRLGGRHVAQGAGAPGKRATIAGCPRTDVSALCPGHDRTNTVRIGASQRWEPSVAAGRCGALVVDRTLGQGPASQTASNRLTGPTVGGAGSERTSWTPR